MIICSGKLKDRGCHHLPLGSTNFRAIPPANIFVVKEIKKSYVHILLV
jgi:hypothetical protein